MPDLPSVQTPLSTRMVAPEDAKLLNASIARRQDLSSELCIVHVAPDAGVPDFKPGQYATLGVLPPPDSDHAKKKGLARLVLRPYSIASTPLQRDLIEFYLSLVPQGQFTPLLWHLHEGDRIYMAPKCKGKFTLDDVPAQANFVTVATGTGIAPFVSMYRTYRETGRWKRFVLIHGTRLSRDLAYRAEMQAFAAKDPALKYICTCSRESQSTGGEADWQGLRGRVNVVLEPSAFRRLAGFELLPENCHVFLCGNPAMIDDIAAELTGRGFTPKSREHPDGNVHLEKYW